MTAYKMSAANKLYYRICFMLNRSATASSRMQLLFFRELLLALGGRPTDGEYKPTVMLSQTFQLHGALVQLTDSRSNGFSYAVHPGNSRNPDVEELIDETIYFLTDVDIISFGADPSNKILMIAEGVMVSLDELDPNTQDTAEWNQQENRDFGRPLVRERPHQTGGPEIPEHLLKRAAEARAKADKNPYPTN